MTDFLSKLSGCSRNENLHLSQKLYINERLSKHKVHSNILRRFFALKKDMKQTILTDIQQTTPYQTCCYGRIFVVLPLDNNDLIYAKDLRILRIHLLLFF